MCPIYWIGTIGQNCNGFATNGICRTHHQTGKYGTKPFLRWVWPKGRSPDTPGIPKNAWGPVGIPLKGGTLICTIGQNHNSFSTNPVEWISVKCYNFIGRVHCVSKIGMIPRPYLNNSSWDETVHSFSQVYLSKNERKSVFGVRNYSDIIIQHFRTYSNVRIKVSVHNSLKVTKTYTRKRLEFAAAKTLG